MTLKLIRILLIVSTILLLSQQKSIAYDINGMANDFNSAINQISNFGEKAAIRAAVKRIVKSMVANGFLKGYSEIAEARILNGVLAKTAVFSALKSGNMRILDVRYFATRIIVDYIAENASELSDDPLVAEAIYFGFKQLRPIIVGVMYKSLAAAALESALVSGEEVHRALQAYYQLVEQNKTNEEKELEANLLATLEKIRIDYKTALDKDKPSVLKDIDNAFTSTFGENMSASHVEWKNKYKDGLISADKNKFTVIKTIIADTLKYGDINKYRVEAYLEDNFNVSYHEKYMDMYNSELDNYRGMYSVNIDVINFSKNKDNYILEFTTTAPTDYVSCFIESKNENIIGKKDGTKWILSFSVKADSKITLLLKQGKKSNDKQLTLYTHDANDINLPKILTLTSSQTEIILEKEASNTIIFKAISPNIPNYIKATINNEGKKEPDIIFSPLSAREWAASRSFSTPGKRTIIAYATDEYGSILKNGEALPLTLTIHPPKSALLTKPIVTPSELIAGHSISVSTSSDKEIPTDAAACFIISGNETHTLKFQPSGGRKWTYNNLTIRKAGNHIITAYVGDPNCIKSKDSNLSNTVNLNVIPAAKVTNIASEKPEVVDGKSMRFTATVSGTVDEANGDQVLLWLDSYKQAMQRVSGTQTWTTTVTNIVGVNGKRDYTARVQNGDLYSTDAPHGTLTVKLSDALLVVDAYDISPQPKRIDKAKLNDHVNFIVDSVGAVNGSIKIKINNWISQSLVNIGANKWKTAESIPLQQAEVKTYYAFVEVKGQEASKSTAKVITVTKDSGLVCPAVASTGDLYDAELLVDRRNESIKNAVLHIDACNGKSDDKTITFSESGSGWKWPGIRIADNYCGTFKVSVTSSKNSYTCVTKVNLGSSSPPIVPPATSNDSALLSSNGVQYRLSERLISGDVWQISLTIESKPADFSLVKGKFSGSGLLTVSGTSAGTVFFTQAGNSWTYQVKGTPGTYSYTPVFKIGTKTFDAPARTFTITNNQNSAPRIPEGSVQCVIQPSNTGQMKFDCSLSNSALSSDVAKLSLQCSDAFSFNIPKVSSNSYMASIDFPVGNRTCDISAHGTNHSIFPFTTNLTISAADIHERNIALGKQLVNQLYKEFAGSYNDKNDSKLRGMLSDDWESVGDGTTLADLEMNLRSSFRIFDQVSYTIQNLQISPVAYGRFRVTYDALIKGQIYKSRIKHEEKSSVSEEVEVDPNGKAKITKTLSGRFWYVQ